MATTVGADEDTWIDRDNPTDHNDTSLTIDLKNDTAIDVFRGVVKFNLVPHVGQIVNSALLAVNFTQVAAGRNYEVRLLDDPDLAIDITTVDWEERGSFDPWVGGDGARGQTVNTGAITGALPAATGDFTFPDISVMVQDALDNRGGILHLYMAITTNLTGVPHQFKSKDVAPDQGQLPGARIVLVFASSGLRNRRRPLQRDLSGFA